MTRSLIPVLVSYLVLAWVLSSALSRGQGFAAFVLLLAPLAAAVGLFRRGRRRALYAVWFGLLLADAGALGLEVVLWVAPGVLRGRVADVAYTGYHWQRGGIYTLDAHAGPVMRPGVERRMYWAGRWWWHRANSAGYRGPRLDRADAVFLGDSMIYGHGVEEDQTVPARWAACTGRSAANLGQQGTSVVQSLLALRRVGLRLRPRVVFVCVHYNDVSETLRDYAPPALAGFVQSPVGRADLPLVREEYAPRPWWDLPYQWSLHVALPLRVGGILGEVVRLWRAGELRHTAPAPWLRPSPDERARPFRPATPQASAEEALAWRAQARALAEIGGLSAAQGARVVVFDIGWPEAFRRAVEEAARGLGLGYVPAGAAALARADSGAPVYLENDGHWSPTGAEVVATVLAETEGR